MKNFLSILAFLMICQVSFSQNDSSEMAKAEQTKKDIKAYADFQKNEDSYKQMQEYKDAEETWKLKDYNKVIDLLKAASAKGNPVAEYAIGNMYKTGQVVPKNQVEAINWFHKSADNGNMYALYTLSEIYDIPGDNTSVQKYFFNTLERCANAGCEPCYSSLASAYEFGDGIKANYAEAVSWYKKGAAKGDYRDLESIARLYFKGDASLGQSKKEALNWYMKSATANTFNGKPFPGSKKAMYQLYKMYNAGDGVEKNQAEGFKWLLKLGEIRESQSKYEDDWMDKALYELGNAYYTGAGVAQNYIEALKWFTRGAEIEAKPLSMLKGKHPNMEKLAIMYREGQGVKKDLKIAEQWQRDADSGDDTL
jgi:hypothetical protein